MDRSRNPAYEFWAASAGRIAVVIGPGVYPTAGYLIPQEGGGWKISVEDFESPTVYPNEHDAAEEIYRMYCVRTQSE